MKRILIGSLIVMAAWGFTGCKKQTPVEKPAAPSEPAVQKPVSVETPVVQKPVPAETPPVAKTEEKLAAIPLELPKPMFVGTPENLSGVENLEKPLGKPRPLFYAPQGTQNVALNKPVTASEKEPITGDLKMVVDGDKEASDGSVVELGPFKQWVQIDLEQECNIYAIVFWHYHKAPRVYFDVVVQVSNNPDFTDVTTVFNNDTDNSLGLGVGSNMNYVETAEGKLVDARGVKGRYVRLYSQGNNQNDYSHYIEVEVYGK
jgi:hypothetical protein